MAPAITPVAAAVFTLNWVVNEYVFSEEDQGNQKVTFPEVSVYPALRLAQKGGRWAGRKGCHLCWVSSPFL